MGATPRNASQKVRLATTSGTSKLEKLSKMDSERAAHDHYKSKISEIWHTMACDEGICLATYALAFDTDKTVRLTHLRKARRSLAKVISTLEESDAKKGRRDYERNTILAHGKKVIGESIKGYVTDDDVLIGEKPTSKVNTKNIRGVGKKKLARGKETKEAAPLYKGG